MNNFSKWIQWGFDPITKKLTMITKSEDGILIEKNVEDLPPSANSFSILDETRIKQKKARENWENCLSNYKKGLTTIDNVINAMNVLNAIEVDIFNEHERVDISNYEGITFINKENDKRVSVKELLGDEYFRYLDFKRNNIKETKNAK